MTNLQVRINKGDPDIQYDESGADYLLLDLTNDYLIWTAGSSDVADGEDEPTQAELNVASTIISDIADVTVEHCLAFDYDASLLFEVEGMGENKQYVFCFSFDGDTATEPQLEAWDDDTHATTDNHVLGNGTPANSMVKAKATTTNPPGEGWTTAPIAGSSNVLLLNEGNGAITLASGETRRDLYANIKIIIPTGYSTPGAETFTLTVRFTWN
jgi:hypothetical protein